jgi:hypothetical protein
VSLRFYPDDVIPVYWLLECPLIFYPEGLILDILITVFYCKTVTSKIPSVDMALGLNGTSSKGGDHLLLSVF